MYKKKIKKIKKEKKLKKKKKIVLIVLDNKLKNLYLYIIKSNIRKIK